MIFINALECLSVKNNLYQWTTPIWLLQSHTLGYNLAIAWNIYLQSLYPAYQVLAHWGQAVHIYVIELCQNCFR